MRDFDGRCAYSMQHHSRAGKLEVDHFDPRRKVDVIQSYDNLFPASRHCNAKKSDTWPNKAEETAGCRFLNPCKEVDYGEQIFEDPTTYVLVGMNPAAVWHIRMCGLNAQHLVHERRNRAKHWATLNNIVVRIKGRTSDVAELVKSFREEVALMIPEIAALPVRNGPR